MATPSDNDDDDKKVSTWQCLCGQFQAEVTGKPFYSACCYCTMCRRFGGTPCAFGIWKEVTIKSGGHSNNLIRYMVDASKGGKNWRYSCKTCGSFCYATDQATSYYFVGLGALEGDLVIRPSKNIFVAHRGNQEILLPDLPQYDELPAP